MELLGLANNIEKEDNGIYFAKNKTKISYPEVGNEQCFQYEENSFWFKHRNDVICSAIKKYSQTSNFFDIGGGNGFVAKRLQEEGLDVALVEPGEVGAINAKKRGVEKVVCSTLKDAGFKERCLDSVGFFDVMEHIEDDHEFLKDITLYLKPGGYLYLTVPAFSFLWSEDDKFAGHYRRYRIPQLKKMLESQGYEVKYATYLFAFLTLPILLFKTIPTKLGFAKDPSLLDNQQDDHNKTGLLSQIMNWTFKTETNRIVNGKTIFAGSTCFVVAKKTVNENSI